jgi:hypothetical protein
MIREGELPLIKAINPYGAIAFALGAFSAIDDEWLLPEFCWSIWLAGLVYAWACVAAASLQILVTARSDRPRLEKFLPVLRRLSPEVFFLAMVAIGVCVGVVGFRIYGFLFGFYGVFLSVFAELEPLTLFGRNGFINSDFYTPVRVLLDRFWPMAVGILVANWEDFLGKNPWKRAFLPFQKEVVRLHVMILALPFVSLIVWAVFKESYQLITILVLMGLLYLWPKKRRGKAGEENRSQPGAQIDNSPREPE